MRPWTAGGGGEMLLQGFAQAPRISTEQFHNISAGESIHRDFSGSKLITGKNKLCEHSTLRESIMLHKLFPQSHEISYISWTNGCPPSFHVLYYLCTPFQEAPNIQPWIYFCSYYKAASAYLRAHFLYHLVWDATQAPVKFKGRHQKEPLTSPRNKMANQSNQS